MRLPAESDPPFEINLVPTIDVIFSILAFFIISTLFLTRSEGLPVNLPQASTAERQAAAEITVTIEASGAIAIDEEPIALGELSQSIQERLEPNAQTLVIVKADEVVSHGRVVGVMDRLRSVEGIRLAIATESPDPQ